MLPSDFLTVLGIGLVVFASTNIDDILLLAAFFSDPHLRPASVVLGQFLGIGVLVFTSAICALAALAVPEGWTALLGVFPLLLGLWKLRPGQAADGDEEQQEAAAQRLHSQVLAVSLVTMANGGDNLGVYIPLFAQEPTHIPLYAGIFALMTCLWCFMGYRLVNNRLIGERVRRYGKAALPFVLIALGLYILSDLRVLFR